jgi:hypothetical protein
MSDHHDRDDVRFDEQGNTRPAGSNYIVNDPSDDGLGRTASRRGSSQISMFPSCRNSLRGSNGQALKVPQPSKDGEKQLQTQNYLLWVIVMSSPVPCFCADPRNP